jgi:HlyD family secretion protein
MAERAMDISPPLVDGLWDFKIASLIAEGTEVKTGDLLIEFDDEGVTRGINEQRAVVEKTQEELNRSQLEHDVRMRDLHIRAEEARVYLERTKHKAEVDAQLTSMQEFRQVQIQLTMATTEAAQLQEKLQATVRMFTAHLATLNNSLAAAQSRLKRLELQQKSLRMTAPISGIVIYKRDIISGEKKTIGQSAWREEVILQIPDLSSLRMQATVDEIDSGAIRAGQSARISLDAFPEIELSGTVKAVGGIIRAKSWDLPVKVVDVSIGFDRTEARLLPGMTATALIEVQRLENILLIPLRAVREKDGRTVVLVAGREGQSVERQVRLGRRDRESIEVLEGLKEGDKIYP